MTCGIYCIENIINKNKYIGKSENIELRFREHINALNRKDRKYENEHLLYSWSKYGKNSFEFYILEECSKEKLSEREIFYIKYLNTKHPYGYNFTDGGEGVSGYKHTEEAILKMSGKNNHRFGIEKEKHFMYGKHHSDETKKKLRDKLLKEKSPVFGTKKENSASKYYGVSFYNHKQIRNGKQYISYYWVAQLKVDRKRHHLGYFKDEISAAKKYDSFIIKNNLKNPLNFPNDYREYEGLENLKL
jgi:group I intron endonuclease